MKPNGIANCTHPVPPNKLGVFAMHSRDNVPLSPAACLAIINGPLTAMQPKLSLELAKVAEEKPSGH